MTKEKTRTKRLQDSINPGFGNEFDAIIEHMDEGYAHHRLIRNEQGEAVDYVFLKVNPAFERITGLKAKKVIGQKISEIVPDINDDPANWISLYGEIVDSQQAHTFERYSSAFNKWFLVNAYSREKDHFTSILKDISEDHRLTTELREARFKAEESERMKAALLANVSHEIRTPLNSILGFSELLIEQGDDAEDIKRYLGFISESGNRLLNTLTDMIKMSIIDSGKIEKQMAAIDPLQLIEDVYNAHFREAKDKGLNIKYFEPEASISHPSFVSDHNMLNTVLNNLVNNAIKYTNKGNVEIGFEYADKHIVFHVTDTGIGISKEAQKAIFQRFVQEDMSIRRKYEGMGIGLSICQSYIAELGGQILVESEKGKGSIFYVEVPVR